MKIILRLLATIVGGWNVASAIMSYNDGDYFVCGIFIMLAVWMGCLIKDSIEGD